MSAKKRNLNRVFSSVYTTSYKNLLVSGCSYTWNRSEEHICTWPYYLRDLCNFEEILDCSQAGSGFNHTFNSVINEIENNSNITPDNTFIIIMWSGLERVDVTANIDLVKSYSNMETHCFDSQLSSLSLFIHQPKWKTILGTDPNKDIELLRQMYRTLIDSKAQVFDSYIKLIALYNYLKNLNFKFVFLEWDSTVTKLSTSSSRLADQYQRMTANIQTLGDYATVNNKRIPNDGHPTPDAHLEWTRTILVPYLTKNNLI